MESKSLVKLSNLIGIVSIILLLYWVFIFVTIEVFGFKVFRENITETFYMSIIGIIALMFGALIINIMFNLTRIAERQNIQEAKSEKSNKKIGWFIVLSFPIIFSLLYIGDFMTSRKKEKMLIQSAESLIHKNENYTSKLIAYDFSKKYISETSEILEILTKTEKNFPIVSLIVRDTIKDNPIFLNFESHYTYLKNGEEPSKLNYITKTTSEERQYLENVFNKKTKEFRYSSSNGSYELFYPVVKNNRTIVLYFSDYQRYGKFGS